MAADHLEFLKDKFITDYKEAVDEFGGELPLRLHFQEILEVLQAKTINESTPIQMKSGLYDLRYLLAECVLSAEKERELQTQNKKSHFISTHTLKKLLFIRRIGKKLIEIRQKLQQTNSDEALVCKAFLQADSITVHLPEDIHIRPLVNASELYGSVQDIHGFISEFHKMEALLYGTPRNDSFKAIGIVGMGGVGKTTLARLVVHKCQFWREFSPIIWVTLSEKANPLKIVGQMLTNLDAKYDQLLGLDAQVTEFYNRLYKRKYLIVLDNVCHPSEWYSDLGSIQFKDGTACISRFSHALPKGSGGAIIVTSRFEEVAISMVGEKNLLRLHPTLDAEALWSTLMDSIRRKKFITPYHHQILSRMKDEIIYRCDGLPLAAKTLAEVISIQLGKQEYWSDSDVPKDFCLKLDLPDHFSYWNVKEKAMTLPGVHEVFPGPGDDKITIRGRCHVIEIAREVGKLRHTELISVYLAQYNEPAERKSIKEQNAKQEESRAVKQRKRWQNFLRL